MYLCAQSSPRLCISEKKIHVGCFRILQWVCIDVFLKIPIILLFLSSHFLYSYFFLLIFHHNAHLFENVYEGRLESKVHSLHVIDGSKFKIAKKLICESQNRPNILSKCMKEVYGHKMVRYYQIVIACMCTKCVDKLFSVIGVGDKILDVLENCTFAIFVCASSNSMYCLLSTPTEQRTCQKYFVCMCDIPIFSHFSLVLVSDANFSNF